MRIFVLVTIAMFCATGAMAAAFQNGGFEDPYEITKTAVVPTGWSTYVTTGGMNWQLEPGGIQLPGSHQWCQMYTTVLGSVGGLYQTFDTIAGSTYTIQGTIAAIHGDMNARLGIVQGGWAGRPADADPSWILTALGSTDVLWHSVATPIVATGSSMTIFVDGENIPGTKTSRLVKWDDIMIPEPGSMIALLSGLVGLVGVIRRRK